MKKSTLWMLVGIGAAVMFAIVGCCTLTNFGADSSSSASSRIAVKENVDLEKLAKAFEDYQKAGNQDINGFEKVVNDKSKGIYDGADYVSMTMEKSGEIIGYVNKNTEPTYEAGKDELVFSMQAEKEKERVVVRDRHDNYYGYRPTGSGFFTGMLIGNMLSRQTGYYGRPWSAPATARFQSPGYYSRVRSAGASSPSARTGSRWGSSGSSSSSRSSSRSGGFGSGK